MAHELKKTSLVILAPQWQFCNQVHFYMIPQHQISSGYKISKIISSGKLVHDYLLLQVLYLVLVKNKTLALLYIITNLQRLQSRNLNIYRLSGIAHRLKAKSGSKQTVPTPNNIRLNYIKTVLQCLQGMGFAKVAAISKVIIGTDYKITAAQIFLCIHVYSSSSFIIRGFIQRLFKVTQKRIIVVTVIVSYRLLLQHIQNYTNNLDNIISDYL